MRLEQRKEMPDPDFDSTEMQSHRTWWLKKTWYVDWSGWLEKQFKKLFKEDKDDVLGKDKDNI